MAEEPLKKKLIIKKPASITLSKTGSPPAIGAKKSDAPRAQAEVPASAPVSSRLLKSAEAFKFYCVYCGAQQNGSKAFVGKTVPCTSCKQPLVVPAPSGGDPSGMKIKKFFCPECQQKLSAPETSAGHKVKCPACKKSIAVPA